MFKNLLVAGFAVLVLGSGCGPSQPSGTPTGQELTDAAANLRADIVDVSPADRDTFIRSTPHIEAIIAHETEAEAAIAKSASTTEIATEARSTCSNIFNAWANAVLANNNGKADALSHDYFVCASGGGS